MVLGHFLTDDERLEEVSTCGRQRLRPHGHRLHMPLERFGFLKGVLDGVVKHRLGHAGLGRTSARGGASPQRVLFDEDLLMIRQFQRKNVSANSQVVATKSLVRVQAPARVEAPLGHWGRSLQAKVVRPSASWLRRSFQRERTSLPAGQREV